MAGHAAPGRQGVARLRGVTWHTPCCVSWPSLTPICIDSKMVQFPMPFGGKNLIMLFAGADVRRDIVSCTRTAFSFGIILSIQVKPGVGGGFLPACRCRFRPCQSGLINKKEFLHAQIKRQIRLPDPGRCGHGQPVISHTSSRGQTGPGHVGLDGLCPPDPGRQSRFVQETRPGCGHQNDSPERPPPGLGLQSHPVRCHHRGNACGLEHQWGAHRPDLSARQVVWGRWHCSTRQHQQFC